ncbi:hypothetical protein EMCRGX_G034661 [Ephydatia muelleri]|eukprot:Em0023g565a
MASVRRIGGALYEAFTTSRASRWSCRAVALHKIYSVPTRSVRQPVALFSSASKPEPPKGKYITVTFVDRDGDEHTVKAKLGSTLLEVAKEHDIEVEGACEGTLACSTCHMIVDPQWFPKIPDPITEEEHDMLDLAFGLTETSRLGCQIIVSPELDGLRLALPKATKDVRNK